MAKKGRPKGVEKSVQSLYLDNRTIEVIEREAARTGMPKSQIVDNLFQPRVDLNTKKRPTIISVMSFKGGVGKTTTSACLGICLGENGHKVLIIDLDGQGSVSQYLDVYDPRAEKPCIADVMLAVPNGKSRKTLEEVTIETQYKNVWIVPSSFRFSESDVFMRSDSAAGVDCRLCHAIEDLSVDYDYIIIDCPPSLGLTVTNAITALEAGNKNSLLVIPVKLDGFAIAGLGQTIKLIKNVAIGRRTSPQEWRILRVVTESNTTAYKLGMSLLEEEFKNLNFFNTKISKSTAAVESTLSMKPLVVYAPNSKPAIEYKTLASEIEALNE